MGEVVHNPDQRDQCPVRRPSSLFIGKTLDLTEHRASEVPQPVQVKLTLVGVPSWELVGRCVHTKTVSADLPGVRIMIDPEHSVRSTFTGVLYGRDAGALSLLPWA